MHLHRSAGSAERPPARDSDPGEALTASGAPPSSQLHILPPPRRPALRDSPRLSRLIGVALRLLLWLPLLLPAFVPSVSVLLSIIPT